MNNLKSAFLNSSYNIDNILLLDYFTFLEEKLDTNIKKPFERHHILPSSLFPEYKKNKENIIKLSPKNHFIAHYLLAKAVKEKQMIFAFYQMKRVLKKYGGDYNDIEYLSNLFSEFKNEERKLRSISMSNTFRGMVPVKFPNGETGIISNQHPDYLNKIVVPVQVGSKRSKESIENFKKCNNSKVKGYPYHNPETKETRYFQREEAPEDWVNGFPIWENSGKPGANFYYNEKTNEQSKFFENEVPEGWKRGRINFGETGNPFSKGMFIDPINKVGVPISKEEPIPKFFHNPHSKNYYFWTDKDGKWFTSKKTCSPKKIDFSLEINKVFFDEQCFDDYSWIYIKQ